MFQGLSWLFREAGMHLVKIILFHQLFAQNLVTLNKGILLQTNNMLIYNIKQLVPMEASVLMGIMPSYHTR